MDATDERYPGHAAVIAYFRDVDSVDCTYAKFLHALRDVILESPPFTEDWSGLDGTWYRRYARLAKEPSAHLPMKLFFEDIIRERKQRIKIAQNTENDRSNRSPLRQTYASRLRKRDDIQRSKAAPAARNAKEELVALEDKWENELEASEDGDEQKSDSDSDDSNPFKDMSLPRSKAGTAPADYSYKPKEGRREKMLQKEPEKYPAPSDRAALSYFKDNEPTEWTYRGNAPSPDEVELLTRLLNGDPSEIVAHYTKIYSKPSTRWHALRRDLELLSKSTSFTLTTRLKATKLLETWKSWAKIAKTNLRKEVELAEVDHQIRRISKERELITEEQQKTAAQTTAKQMAQYQQLFIERTEKLRHTQMAEISSIEPTTNYSEEEYENEVEREEYVNEEIPESLDYDEGLEPDEIDRGNAYHVNEMKTADKEHVKEIKRGPSKLSEANHKEIEETYKSMNRQNMWKLSSGRFVEEELFRLGKDLEFEHSVHSFIVDVDDEIIKRHFSEEELHEIDYTPSPQVPELSDKITTYLSKFINKTDLNEIRSIIKEEYLARNYDREKHYDIDYILYVLYTLVREIENKNLKGANLENWYNCHIWNAIVDQGFGNLDGISVVRGESASVATGIRKNMQRQIMERRKMGYRCDWILRSAGNGDRDEFGVGEAGKERVDEFGTKFLRETCVKLPKTLKDMLVKLMKKVNWEKELCAKIQTIGIIHAGLMMMVAYLDNPQGYVCRIRRGERMDVPDVAENFPSILTLLASILNAKAAVRETIKAIQSRGPSIQMFKDAGLRKRPPIKDHVMPCMSTPKKAKVAKVALPSHPH